MLYTEQILMQAEAALLKMDVPNIRNMLRSKW